LPIARSCLYERDEALHGAARAAHRAAVHAVAARGLPVAAVDLVPSVCAGERCPVMRDRVVVFTDDNHLTASFTRATAPVLGAQVDAALASVGVRLP
jgi:hypothetical protein